MEKQKNDFNIRKAPHPVLILGLIALLVFTPALKIIIGIVTGIIGLVVGLVVGIFGLVIGLVGGAIGLVLGILAGVFGLVVALLPLIFVAWVITLIIRNGQEKRTVDLSKQKNDFV